MNKKSLYYGLLFYSGVLAISGFFLVNYLMAFYTTGDIFPLFLVIFNSFVIGYCAKRLTKLIKMWNQYRKYGVKGTWEN